MKQYNPKKVAVIVDGVQLTGFFEDTFVELDYREDAVSLSVGTDGEGTLVDSNDFSATVKVTLAQSSASNQKLQALFNARRASGEGTFTVLVKDASGKDIHLAEQTVIQKGPAAAYGKKGNGREWTMITDNLVSNLGGN